MPAIEFPYTRHKGYFMPIVPVSINAHKIWAFVDSGATFSVMAVGEAARVGIDWQSGRRQMIVVGDGSYIPTFIHDLPVQIGDVQSPFQSASPNGSVLASICSAVAAFSTNSRSVSTTEPAV